MTDIWNKRSLHHLPSSPQTFTKTVAKKSISDTIRSQTKGPPSQLDQMLKGRYKKYSLKNILQLGFSIVWGFCFSLVVWGWFCGFGFFYNYRGHSNKLLLCICPLKLFLGFLFFTIWIDPHSYNTIIAKTKIYMYSPCMTFLFLTDMVY